MTRSNLDGPTLSEKKYGPGYRDDHLQQIKTVTYNHCIVDECPDAVGCTMELYIDDAPPSLDWMSRLMTKLFSKYPRAWVTVPFCLGHGTAAMEAGLDYIEQPDLWAPGRVNPPVFPHPIELTEKPKLIVPGEG